MHYGITGATGIIGGALWSECRRRGEVTIFGRRVDQAVELTAPNVTAIPIDLTSPVDFASLEGIDCLFHCATPNDQVCKDFGYSLDLGIRGTRSLLEACIASGVKHFVFLSTLQVYGRELSGHYDEASPVVCETNYAFNHLSGEFLCQAAAFEADLKVTVIRPSNVFGPVHSDLVDRDTLVPYCFVEEAMQFGTITLRSSGLQKRNFIIADDLAGLLINHVAKQERRFEVANVASDVNYSILHMAELVAERVSEVTNKQVKVTAVPQGGETENVFEIGSTCGGIVQYGSVARQKFADAINGIIGRNRYVDLR